MLVPLTISDFLDRSALVYPDRVAVVDEPGTPGNFGRMTYGELEARALGMAAALDDLGVPVGGRVGIVSPNSARFLIAFFGVSGYGRVLVPINFRLNASEVGYIVEHSGTDVLLVDPEVRRAHSQKSAARDADRSRRCQRRRFVRARSPPAVSRRVGRPTRTPRARSITPRARRPGRRASSSHTATAR